MSSKITFSDKEIRKYEKKARVAEQKYKDTGDTKFLTVRDNHNDTISNLKRNVSVNLRNEKKKLQNKKKSDDQLINEAMRQNRRERNEKEKQMKEKNKKEQKLLELKMKNKENLIKKKKQDTELKIKEQEDNKEKNEKLLKYRSEFIKKYMKENPDSNESTAQKEFMRDYEKQMEMMEFKLRIMKYMISQGMNIEQAEKLFHSYMKQMNGPCEGCDDCDNHTNITDL